METNNQRAKQRGGQEVTLTQMFWLCVFFFDKFWFCVVLSKIDF